MADEIEEVAPAAATQEPEPKAPSHREVLERRFDEFVKSESEGATQEAPAGETPAAEAPPKAEAEAAEAKPAETPPPAAPAKIEVTPEQLADTKYWGSLDAEGWARMERDYPVATAHVKAGQAAASRIVREARSTVQQPSPQRVDATASDEEFSPEYLEAIELSQSLDVKEAARGRRLLAKYDAKVIAEEIGIDPEQSKADAIAQSAYSAALAEMPELATFNMQELAKIVEADPALKYLVEEVGTPEAITSAMLSSGRAYKTQKAAAAVAATAAAEQKKADEKKNANLKVVQSNARPASADLVTSKGAPPAKLSPREIKSQRYDAEVARQGGNSRG